MHSAPQGAVEQAIRSLHVAVYDGYIGETVCSHCSDEDRWAIWPCRTIVVVEEVIRGNG